ncbi:hypothetical protein Asppvi_009929 [Aspergillus pseudoviridinutans]|uniref:Uncharacterized protein n=1 Tax=Aspergillus pseudoviridinutans TaxID=1517512 RepID=A0A9P3BIJ5_9EURO|nr:uncharacterized protein Asppvi_009929 [Aspergillus pseudoviridinutans]GIJ90964.1 hypothetical protein Asppvi_009929 [Aspergillus pseudoviridinutans]
MLNNNNTENITSLTTKPLPAIPAHDVSRFAPGDYWHDLRLSPTTVPALPAKRLWTYDLDLDSSTTLEPVAKALSSLSSLQALTVSIKGEPHRVGEQPLPPLNGFKDLLRFAVTCSGDIPRPYCEREIRPLIEASPALIEFSVQNFARPANKCLVQECVSLQRFFHPAKPDLQTLELVRVPLPSPGLKATLSSTLRQLSVSTPPASRGVDFAWKALWSSLQETRTELSALKVSGSERAMDDMFQYLLSYNGLQKLEIMHLQMDHHHEEDKLAETFWDKIVPHVRATLATLTITTRYEGDLCYGPSAAAALLQCLLLKDVTLSIGTVSTPWAAETFSQARNDRRVEFSRLDDPHGSPVNCGALVLCSLEIPLETLVLTSTRAAADRAADIYRLNSGTRSKGSPQVYRAIQQRQKKVNGIEEVLLGMRTPVECAANWPLTVVVESSSRLCRQEANSVVYYKKESTEDD